MDNCHNNGCIVKHDRERNGWFCFICNNPFIPAENCRDQNCAACVFEDITDQGPAESIDGE